MQTVKILIIRRILRRLIGAALFAYVHFYRTLCTGGISNGSEILQFHDCNVTLYTEKETVRKDKINPYVLCPGRIFFFYLNNKMFRVGPKT